MFSTSLQEEQKLLTLYLYFTRRHNVLFKLMIFETLGKAGRIRKNTGQRKQLKLLSYSHHEANGRWREILGKLLWWILLVAEHFLFSINDETQTK